MTDWWAMSYLVRDMKQPKTTHAPMVSAGNDVFMVCTDCSDMGQDDVKGTWKTARSQEATCREMR